MTWLLPLSSRAVFFRTLATSWCLNPHWLSLGCHKRTPWPGGLPRQMLIPMRCWRLDAQDQGAGRFGFWWDLSPWFADGHHLPPCVLTQPFLCTCTFFVYLPLLFKNIDSFLWLHPVLVLVPGIFSCGMWDLVPHSGIAQRPPAWGAWSLSHWTTREVLPSLLKRAPVLLA